MPPQPPLRGGVLFVLPPPHFRASPGVPLPSVPMGTRDISGQDQGLSLHGRTGTEGRCGKSLPLTFPSLSISESPLLLPLPLCPGKSSHLKGPDHQDLTHGGTHSHSHKHKVATLSCTYTHSHTPSHSQSPTQPQGQTGTHPEKSRKSSRVTKPLTQYTLPNKDVLTQLQKYTHTWSHTHTHRVTKSLFLHTDRYRAIHSHTHTERETDTHSCTQAPGDKNNAIVWAGSSWGEREPQCMEGPALYHPHSPPQHPKPLSPLPEAEFSWALDLLSRFSSQVPSSASFFHVWWGM